jgi:hypothetical protein
LKATVTVAHHGTTPPVKPGYKAVQVIVPEDKAHLVQLFAEVITGNAPKGKRSKWFKDTMIDYLEHGEEE